MHSSYFPKTVPRSGIPLPSTGSRALPSTGSRAVRFPRFCGTIRMLRLPASRPAALRFLRLAVPRSHLLFAPRGSRCQSHGPGAFSPSQGTPKVTLHAVEKTGPPKFLRDPNHLFAHALRLRRNRHATRQYRRGGVAPAKGTTRASTMGLSKLNHMASRLAVYASKCGLPQHDARLAFGCWLGSTAWDSHPQGLKERFQLLIHFRILLSQA